MLLKITPNRLLGIEKLHPEAVFIVLSEVNIGLNEGYADIFSRWIYPSCDHLNLSVTTKLTRSVQMSLSISLISIRKLWSDIFLTAIQNCCHVITFRDICQMCYISSGLTSSRF